jgi:flagellar basal body rod protein FlgG
MFDSLYNAAEAMQRSTTDFEAVSHNLANVNTAGFRRLVAQHPETQHPLVPGPSPPDTVGLDLLPGPLVQTGHNLDIALDGPGFIELAGPAGPIFTRDGRLQVALDGTLTSISGLPVQGENGPIKIPEGGRVEFGIDGSVLADNVQVGKISIQEPSDPQGVVQAGENTYKIANPVPSDETRVLQGMHEASNVSAVMELIRMIEAMRRYEAAQKTITTVSEAVQRHTTSD